MPAGAYAATSAMAQNEIDHLLRFVEESKCEFYRNGIGYDSKQAQTHLRRKYESLEKHKLIVSAEDFVEKVATKSSASGYDYQIQCSGQAVVSSRQWFSDELARYRAESQNRKD